MLSELERASTIVLTIAINKNDIHMYIEKKNLYKKLSKYDKEQKTYHEAIEQSP